MRMFSAFAVLAFACAALLLAAAGGASAQQSIITRQMFESMLSHRGDSGCEGAFYTYDAFVQAAKAFPALGTTGNDETRRRELAAFFGQTSHETTGGWATAPGGQFAWGYCRVKEQNPTDPPYYGRGPIQLTHKYNYEQAGEGLGMGMKLVNDPDLVSRDPVVAFKTALWFWMTPQSDKPSCHAVMTNNWTPSGNDRNLGRLPGYGMTSNIINGGQECGKGQSTEGAKDRVGFYKSYCDMLGVGYGDNVPCRNMKPYGG